MNKEKQYISKLTPMPLRFWDSGHNPITGYLPAADSKKKIKIKK
jgi:hypothetical protein